MGSADAKEALGIILITVGIMTGGTSGTLPWYGSMAVTTGVGMLSASIQEARFKNREQPQGFRSTIRNTRAAHNIVFGESRVGGILAAADVDSEDASNDTLHMVVMHSVSHQGGCEGITNVFLGQQEIQDSEIDDVTGAVTGGQYQDIATIWRMRGTASQAALPSVYDHIDGLDVDSRFTQIAYTYLGLKRPADNEEFREKFPHGIPDVSVILKGQRVYDPRLDSTEGGAGSHDKLNALTWSYSNNPALCLATYLIMNIEDGGAAWDPDTLNWDTVAAAADICDELRTVPDGVGGTVAQFRYRCNVILSTGARLEDNILTILETMVGDLIWAGGKWCIQAGAYSVPAIEISDEDLRGPITGAPHEMLEDVYNEVRVKYIDADAFYTETDAIIKQDATYVAQDNGYVQYKEVNLVGCTDEYQAQYIRNIWLRRSRQQEALTLPMNLRGLDIAPGMRISYTSALRGVVAKVYKVERWKWNAEEGAPDIEIVEDDPSVWTSAIGDYNERDIRLPLVGIKFPDPPIPLNPSAVSVADGINVTWTCPAAHTYIKVDVFRADDASGAPGTFSRIRQVDGESYFDPVTDGGTYWYKMRTRNQYGKVSDFTAAVSNRAKRVADGAPTGSVNLLPVDAVKEYCYDGATARTIVRWTSTLKLETIGVAVGEFISLSMQIITRTGTKGAQLEVSFISASGGTVQSNSTSFATFAGWAVVTLEALEIPPTTDRLMIRAKADANAGKVCVRNIMLNSGPIAAPFAQSPAWAGRNVSAADPEQESDPAGSTDDEAPWRNTSPPSGGGGGGGSRVKQLPSRQFVIR